MSWPTELRFNAKSRTLTVQFDDGVNTIIPYLKLRQESPSAENKGHGNQPPPESAPIPEDIGVIRAEPTGRYAVRIEFSDGHKTGLYTWDLLKSLGSAPQI